jgi:hypothetical protein
MRKNVRADRLDDGVADTFVLVSAGCREAFEIEQGEAGGGRIMLAPILGFLEP